MSYFYDLSSYFAFGLNMLNSVLNYIVSEGRELLLFVYLFPVMFIIIALVKRFVS